MDRADERLRHLAEIHAGLGIPPDYAAARSLVPQFEAVYLVSIGLNADKRKVQLAPPAAEAWRRLRGAARQDKVSILPVSGFRSVERQTEIIRRKLDAGQGIEAILRFVAAPGYSEHHTGRAIDIGTPGDPPLEESFERTPAFAWLRKEAARFGFRLSYPRGNAHGFGYEPWHWCWRG